MAQADYFLKIDGIEGGTLDDRHKGAMDVLAFSWSESQAQIQQGTGGSIGRVKPNPFAFEKLSDRASPALMAGCATGKHFRTAVLTGRRPGGVGFEFLTITMEDVLIASYEIRTSESGTDQQPIDRAMLTFGTLEIVWREQRPDGSVGTETRKKFDFVRNREL